MTGQTSQLADGIDPLVRPCLDVDAARGGIQQAHNILLHGRLERGHFGSLQNERHVNVANLVAVLFHDIRRVLHEFARIAALPPGIGILKDLSNIRQGQRPENGVHDGVVNHVAVRMRHDAELRLVMPPGVPQ